MSGVLGLRGAARRRTAVVVVGVVVAATALSLVATKARSAPSLPRISAQSLLASTVRALRAAPPVSGTVQTNADLGVPSLPSNGPDAATGPAALLLSFSGRHTLRVWSSRDGFRVADLLPEAERSITVSRTNAWAWDSSSYTAWHLGPFPAASPPAPPPAMPDPLTIARQALAAVTPTTRVTIERTAWVAGRAAYVLVLQPRTPATLVGSVQISIDATTRIPLGVAVYARGASSPAVSGAFTSVSFAPIAPSTYRFSPPHGAKVVALKTPATGQMPPAGSAADRETAHERLAGALGKNVRVFGAGWTTIVAVRVPAKAVTGSAMGASASALFPITGPLVSVDLVRRGTDDWIVVGAVPRSALLRVEPGLP